MSSGGRWPRNQKQQDRPSVPIPDAPAVERNAIGDLALRITAASRARYELHHNARNRIRADLGAPDKALNQKLTAWWDLDLPSFRTAIPNVFTHDIPLKDRDD